MVFQILIKPKQPLRNTRSHGISFDDRQRFISEQIMERIKRTPELVGILDTLVNDHFQGPVDFFDTEERVLGPTKMKQVKKFWLSQKVMQAFYGQGMDYFVDGSSFGWHVNANNIMTSKQKEAIVKLKQLDANIGLSAHESSMMPRSISYLAASTVEIKHDEFGEISYLQDAAGKLAIWKPDQVVHIKLMEFNGEIRGFSGLKALVKEIAMMFELKQNMLALLENGGSPDSIISIIKSQGGSKARFDRLQTALESFSHLRKSHGNMPIDAEVKVHKMTDGMRDMEFRELAMFALSEFCLALGIPISRIPFLMTGSGGNANKGELAGTSEDAYQNKVNNRRNNWQNEWNQVFREAGFMFKFRTGDINDELRETQASAQRASYVSETQNVLRTARKKLKEEPLLQLLSGTKVNIELRDIEELSEEEMNPGFPMGNGLDENTMKANQVKNNDISEVRSQFRTKVASNKGVNA